MSIEFVKFGLGLASGAFATFVLHFLTKRKVKEIKQEKVDDQQLDLETLKTIKPTFAIGLRKDLKMGKGKIAAQVGHASLSVYKKALKQNSELATFWRQSQDYLRVFYLNNEEELLLLNEQAEDAQLSSHFVCDAGRTQVDPGSFTVIGIFGPLEQIESITSSYPVVK
ncbi:MAG: putative Peptidyl-tRNA hydrolase [Streblomastix strix]|uniref:peptidyl-tRNA hydrolase n=1 Tax=Streblomastix strix TaxID=222440 RepID=A0A5J4TV07_9EUKA|nr:MAG: putative Peptidyl-tRNA hydrolase [Streblomastix strix]